jgi:hypothetical protein
MSQFSADIEIMRKSSTTTEASFTASDQHLYTDFRNDGANDIKIYIDGDGSTDYWTLKPGAEKTIGIITSKTIKHKTITGTSSLEVVCWG